MEKYNGYELHLYPKCEQYPEHDNCYSTFKSRPYDDSDYYWAYTYDKKHWKIVYRGKCVDNNFVGTFEDVIDFIEEKNKNINQRIVHF